jgi:elongation factor G
MTQGKGGFSMEFLKYQKVPTKMQEDIIKKIQAENAKK